jgi:plasmid stabilization system protein ParE
VPARTVRLHPDAERDLEDGLAFYLERSLTAAGRFLMDVEAALDLVAEAPERWPTCTAGTRRYVMAAFPYSLIYRIPRSDPGLRRGARQAPAAVLEEAPVLRDSFSCLRVQVAARGRIE